MELHTGPGWSRATTEWSHVLTQSESRSKSCWESEARLADALHPVWLHWSYFMLQSVQSWRHIPTDCTCSESANARHTFNLNTLYNFSSTSQLCAALCWSQIKAQSDAFKFVVVTWAVWRLSRDCMLMKLMNWRSVNKYRHEKKRKGRKTARKTSETWAGGADRAWGRFVL